MIPLKKKLNCCLMHEFNAHKASACQQMKQMKQMKQEKPAARKAHRFAKCVLMRETTTMRRIT